MITVIIPTLWTLPQKFCDQLQKICDSPYVSEIIIVNNNVDPTVPSNLSLISTDCVADISVNSGTATVLISSQLNFNSINITTSNPSDFTITVQVNRYKASSTITPYNFVFQQTLSRPK